MEDGWNEFVLDVPRRLVESIGADAWAKDRGTGWGRMRRFGTVPEDRVGGDALPDSALLRPTPRNVTGYLPSPAVIR
ncbi:MAG: hypothetical protein AVDCRST_MAG87-2645 [uncultured Thermomicrobiales bacterium]|uniref:Uncharacterized protein n=1 Tax=uncultured Thermomicrobiales bacterium TaxID=1645740 RepID=A0A6J4VAE6_9BACT|nr:MAG: hypothetical protein AVDCRST_MAG87-2645 [uncultured Thermomicrobiales bacterium]